MALTNGTDAGNAIGDYIEMGPTASWAEDLYDGLTKEHSSTGAHDSTKVAMLAGTQTFTGDKTFTGTVTLPDGSVDTSTLAESVYTYLGDYSTSESATPYKWINGSIIYKKTVNFGALPNASQKSVAHGITNLGQMVRIEGVSVGGLPVNFANPLSNNSAVGCYTDSSNLYMITNSNRSTDSVYVTLWYTKTS